MEPNVFRSLIGILLKVIRIREHGYCYYLTSSCVMVSASLVLLVLMQSVLIG